jgi:hypothetical protein
MLGSPRRRAVCWRKRWHYPEKLGEGKLEGAKDNDIYLPAGVAARTLGEEDTAADCFARATLGDTEPAGMMFYKTSLPI